MEVVAEAADARGWSRSMRVCADCRPRGSDLGVLPGPEGTSELVLVSLGFLQTVKGERFARGKDTNDRHSPSSRRQPIRSAIHYQKNQRIVHPALAFVDDVRVSSANHPAPKLCHRASPSRSHMHPLVENAHTCFRIVILPDVISRCYFNPDWSNIENIPNIVTVGWKTFILHGHLRVVSPEASNASSPKACVLGAFA
jgi:hypothetical protein